MVDQNGGGLSSDDVAIFFYAAGGGTQANVGEATISWGVEIHNCRCAFNSHTLLHAAVGEETNKIKKRNKWVFMCKPLKEM